MHLSPRTRDLIFLSVVCFICFLWKLGAPGLFDFNEGYYTGVARDMYLRGDYVTPRFNGTLFFDKPPLAIWLSVISFHLFGVSEFTARLPVALSATLLIFLTYAFGTRFLSRRAGLFGAAMLAMNPLFLATARQMTMDIHQTLFFAAAMYCFYAGRQTENKRWHYGFWACCGLAFMAKSAPGLIPIIAVAAFVLIENRFRFKAAVSSLAQCRPVVGVGLLLLVIAPWFYLAWRANGHVFYQEYFLHHHVQLLNGKDFNHVQPIWYYVPALAAGFFPWSLFLPWSIRRRGDHAPRQPYGETELSNGRVQLFLLVWACVVILLFSIMKSKLVSYLLPMLPAAALLVGDWIARSIEMRRSEGVRAGMSIAAGIALCATAVVVIWLAVMNGTHLAAKLSESTPPDVVRAGEICLAMVAAGFLASTLAVWWIRLRMGLYGFVGSCVVAAVLLIGDVLPTMERTMNSPLHDLARKAGERMSQGLPLAIHIGNPIRPSVFFYMPDSAVTATVLVRSEKPPIDEFLQSHRPAYVLTDRKRADALLQTTRKLDIEEQRGQWVLIRAEPLDRTPEVAHISTLVPAHL